MKNEQDAAAQYTRWAEQQLTDYRNRCPGSIFSRGLSLTVQEGYRLQNAVSKLRIQEGDSVVGYKVGCTSPTIRNQLGIQHSVTGRLYKSEHHRSGAHLKRQAYSNLAIEGELAVILSKTPEQSDFMEEGIPTCLSTIIPVIELHNHVMHETPPSPGELIANNAIHAGFVAGDATQSSAWNGKSELSIMIDDDCVATCKESQLIETIRTSLQWLQTSLAKTGDRLQKGQIILTGSIPALIPIKHACTVEVNAPPFGKVKAFFQK